MSTAGDGTAPYQSGGAGGKFRKKPLRRIIPATPYSRPLTAVKNNNPSLLKKLVDPASRLISAGAHRLFDVFRKSLPPLSLGPPEINEEPQNVLHKEGENGSSASISAATGISELELLLQQKTFTRLNSMKMDKRKQGNKMEGSSTYMDMKATRMELKSILRDIEYMGPTHMTWKEKKALENKKVVSLGGKPPKKQRLPLSVARVAMKNQKERDQKMLQENILLGQVGGKRGNRSKQASASHKPEDRVLMSTAGRFRNGVLDVKDLLKSNGASGDHGGSRSHGFRGGSSSHGFGGGSGGHGFGKGGKKKGGKKNRGKKGGRRKGH